MSPQLVYAARGTAGYPRFYLDPELGHLGGAVGGRRALQAQISPASGGQLASALAEVAGLVWRHERGARPTVVAGKLIVLHDRLQIGGHILCLDDLHLLSGARMKKRGNRSPGGGDHEADAQDHNLLHLIWIADCGLVQHHLHDRDAHILEGQAFGVHQAHVLLQGVVLGHAAPPLAEQVENDSVHEGAEGVAQILDVDLRIEVADPNDQHRSAHPVLARQNQDAHPNRRHVGHETAATLAPILDVALEKLDHAVHIKGGRHQKSRQQQVIERLVQLRDILVRPQQRRDFWPECQQRVLGLLLQVRRCDVQLARIQFDLSHPGDHA
mmetsp:Transcript_93272/g.237314  ORF Transcript_93272/g.237314 Transcript_93272/m.237314 type:complete len:326 (+) Transcript_93272:456-1433(+)